MATCRGAGQFEMAHNNSMQRTALRAAAEPERYTDHHGDATISSGEGSNTIRLARR
jgi:hypothetical protein